MTLKDASERDDATLITAATERIKSSRTLRKQKHSTMLEDMAVCIPTIESNTHISGWGVSNLLLIPF